MENLDTNQSLFGLKIDDNVQQKIKDTANWAGISAMVSLIGSIIGFAGYFITRARVARMYKEYGLSQTPVDTSGLITAVISLGIGIALFVLLFNFSTKAKKGVDGNSAELIKQGIGNLAIYFKMVGVLLIIVILIIVLAMLFGLGRMF